jgi:hypothetical protein
MTQVQQTLATTWKNIASVIKKQAEVYGSLINYGTLTAAYNSQKEIQKKLLAGEDVFQVDPFGVFGRGKLDVNAEIKDLTEEKRKTLNEMSTSLESVELAGAISQVNSSLDSTVGNADLASAAGVVIQDRDVLNVLQTIVDSNFDQDVPSAVDSRDSIKLLSGLFLLLDQATDLQAALTRLNESGYEEEAKVTLRSELERFGKAVDAQFKASTEVFNKLWQQVSSEVKDVFIEKMQNLKKLFSVRMDAYNRDQVIASLVAK